MQWKLSKRKRTLDLHSAATADIPEAEELHKVHTAVYENLNIRASPTAGRHGDHRWTV